MLRHERCDEVELWRQRRAGLAEEIPYGDEELDPFVHRRRRVSFDRRDGSVYLHRSGDFDSPVRIGQAEGFDRDWTATAPDGTMHHGSGRKDAAVWLIKMTGQDRARAETERQEREVADEAAVAESLAILSAVRPRAPPPRPLRLTADSRPMFAFWPGELRDLLLALTVEGEPRQLPLGIALGRVIEHDVVIFTMRDPYDAHPLEWGHLFSVGVDEPEPQRPDLGAYAEFTFERADGGESEIALAHLGETALVTNDAVVVDYEEGLLVIVIAEEAPDLLDVPASNAVEWHREAMIDIAQSEPPSWLDDDDELPPEARPDD